MFMRRVMTATICFSVSIFASLPKSSAEGRLMAQSGSSDAAADEIDALMEDDGSGGAGAPAEASPSEAPVPKSATATEPSVDPMAEGLKAAAGKVGAMKLGKSDLMAFMRSGGLRSRILK